LTNVVDMYVHMRIIFVNSKSCWSYCAQKGVSALSMAAEIADPALVDLLLAAGADVTLVDQVEVEFFEPFVMLAFRWFKSVEINNDL